MKYHQAYFFDDGVRFRCRTCGGCCTGEPGLVRVSEEDTGRIAKFLDMPPEHFLREYTEMRGDIQSIRELPNGDCVFYSQGTGCTIYPVRPPQCKTYPFWIRNLRNAASWQREQRECPGIGTGALYSREEILEILQTPDIP